MNKLFSCLSFVVMVCATLSSCEKIDALSDGDDAVEAPSSSVTRSVRLVTRAAGNDVIAYPVNVYAFDKDGKNVATATITDGDDTSAQLTLKKGKYHLTAVSLPSDYSPLSSVQNVDDAISMPSEGYAKAPLMTGSADISVSSSDQTANISLGYRQACLSLTVNGVPESVTGVDVSLSSAYTDMTLAGNLSGQMMVTVPCLKGSSDGKTVTWTTDRFYVLPSVNSQPTITIALKGGPKGDVSYSHTYNATLLAGTPYYFTANYVGKEDEPDVPVDEDVTIKADISAGKWADPVSESFSFGDESALPDVPSISESSVVTVSSIPGAGDIWNGHVIAVVDDISDNECMATLISIKEWDNVMSAFSETPNEAKDIAASYEENGLSGWSIPDKGDANALHNLYSFDTNRSLINASLATCGGAGLIQVYGTTTVRYLCDNAEYTYSYKSATQTKAGTKTKYYLRLVKNLKFIKK